MGDQAERNDILQRAIVAVLEAHGVPATGPLVSALFAAAWAASKSQASAAVAGLRGAEAGRRAAEGLGRGPVGIAAPGAAVPPVDRSQRVLTNGRTEAEQPGYRETDATGQQQAYVVLTAEERAKGWVRPLRNAYRHVGARPKYPLADLTRDQVALWGDAFDKWEAYPEGAPERGPDGRAAGKFWRADQLRPKCGGSLTTMGPALAETYARDPTFYSGTFCVACGAHYPLEEFVWDGTSETVGS